MSAENVSADLLWEVCNPYNAFLVKRKMSGGVRLSRDPLNLTNVHTRKQQGFVNDKAIGIQAEEDGGMTLITKTKKQQQPTKSLHKTTFSSRTPSRKTYRAITGQTAKQGYRVDLTQDAVARASAIKYSQKPKKDRPIPKPRGAKARKAQEV